MDVFSPEELKAVDWRQRPDGFADIRLRRGIEQIEHEDQSIEYRAEEVYLVDYITEEEATERFDELWQAAERNAMTEKERIAATESASEDNLEAVAELGEIIASQDSRMEEQEAAIAELGDLIASMQGGEQ